MPVLNRKSVEDELKKLVKNGGNLKANFVLGFMWAYSHFIDNSIVSYDLYCTPRKYAVKIKIEYKDGRQEEVNLCP